MNKLTKTLFCLCCFANAPTDRFPYEIEVKQFLPQNTLIFETFSNVMNQGINQSDAVIEKIIQSHFDLKLILLATFHTQDYCKELKPTVIRKTEENVIKKFKDIFQWCIFDPYIDNNPNKIFNTSSDRFMQAYLTLLECVSDQERPNAQWAGNFFAIYYLQYLISLPLCERLLAKFTITQAFSLDFISNT